MIRILSLFALVGGVMVSMAWVAGHPGAVSITWGGYLVETSLAALFFAVLVLCLAVAVLYRSYGAVRAWPGIFLRHRAARRQQRGLVALGKSLTALAAGLPKEAGREASRANRLLKDPAIGLFLSALSAQARNDDTQAEKHFTALLENPEASFLGLKGLAGLAARQGNNAHAALLLSQARERRPHAPWVLQSELDHQLASEHWAEAAATLVSMVRRGFMDSPTGEKKLAAIVLEQSRALFMAGEKKASLKLAEKACRLDPLLVPAQTHRAECLRERGKHRRARSLLAESWARTPHPLLAEAYGRLEPRDSALERLQGLTRLVRDNADHAESHLALARGALDARLWGEARRHLERARAKGALRRAWLMQAELIQSEGRPGETPFGALQEAAKSPAEKGWLCAACAAPAPDWRALCPRCGALAMMIWARPEDRPVGPDSRFAGTPPRPHAASPAERSGEERLPRQDPDSSFLATAPLADLSALRAKGL